MSVLTKEEEQDLSRRIIRLAQIGMPLTGKVIRKSVYKYVETKSIRHNFNRDKQMAGRKWLKLFLSRHEEIAQRKAQTLNPARAQKVNSTIFNDYFSKLKEIMTEKDLFQSPHLIYNMDEKGVRLTLHHQQQVLARKGEKRVHIIAPEHAENVIVVGCGNALGQAVPPMVLFKGKRKKDDWIDGMPPGTAIEMTPKGSMTTKTFVKWLDHFSKYKSDGHALLIMDGAASHLDITVVEAAERHSISLLCLPSNTTHELQPLDKSVFRSFEYHWDEEVLNYWTNYPERKITRERFGKILAKVYPKAMSPQNLQSGFRSTGIYPYDMNVIPEVAFAPSRVSFVPQPNNKFQENHNELVVNPEAESDSDSDSNSSY